MELKKSKIGYSNFAKGKNHGKNNKKKSGNQVDKPMIVNKLLIMIKLILQSVSLVGKLVT